jgi:serine phosphatase RsbU (regulator of sigma subunit)
MISIADEQTRQISDNTSFQSLKEEYSKLYSNNKELMEGVYYAASVQQALLPQSRHFDRYFKDYFVIYKPMQIIGGDLYWVGSKNNIVYFGAADCSGHGVSGALLSVLAVSFLNYVVLSKEHEHLGQILEEIDKKWLETFNKPFDSLFDNDWMELSLCSFDFKTRELKFAGANNNLFLVNDDVLKVIKGNAYPIGGWQIEKNRTFNEQRFILNDNTMLYIGSDGFKDQFGGPGEKRLTRKGLKKLLLRLHQTPTDIQKQLIEQEFDKWKGILPQTDDMCIMGIRL